MPDQNSQNMAGNHKSTLETFSSAAGESIRYTTEQERKQLDLKVIEKMTITI